MSWTAAILHTCIAYIYMLYTCYMYIIYYIYIHIPMANISQNFRLSNPAKLAWSLAQASCHPDSDEPHLLQLAYVTSHCDKCPHIMIDVPTMCIICGIIPLIILYNEWYND